MRITKSYLNTELSIQLSIFLCLRICQILFLPLNLFDTSHLNSPIESTCNFALRLLFVNEICKWPLHKLLCIIITRDISLCPRGSIKPVQQRGCVKVENIMSGKQGKRCQLLAKRSTSQLRIVCSEQIMKYFRQN